MKKPLRKKINLDVFVLPYVSGRKKSNHTSVRILEGSSNDVSTHTYICHNRTSLNKLLSKSHSPYIAILDASSQIEDDCIDHLMQIITKSKAEEFIFELRTTPQERAVYYDPITGYTKWASESGVVIKREILQELGGFCAKSPYPMLELSWRAYLNGYYIKYVHSASISCRPQDNHMTITQCNYIKGLHPSGFMIPDHTIMVQKQTPTYRYQALSAGAPLVSILIRTCNRPKLLRECLQSISQQTYRNIEVIIVEDGKDYSAKVRQEFSALNIKYQAARQKVGRCKVGNIALSMATGKYCNFLDDDDVFYPEHIEALVNALEQSEDKIAYADSFLAQYDGQLENYRIVGISPFVSGPFQKSNLLAGNLFPIQAVMFEKSVYDQLGGIDEKIDVLEDWDLWLKYSTRHHFCYVPYTTSIFKAPLETTTTAEQRRLHMEKFYQKIRSRYTKKG